MSDNHKVLHAVQLPADLVARMDELKNDRESDRDKSIDELVEQFCREYVKIREMHREELANMDAINRSYEERPHDYDDAEEWEKNHRETTERKQ